jgi:hypothetical protein
MTKERHYAFALQQAVTVKNGPKGVVIDRAEEPDRSTTVDVTSRNAAQLKAKPGERVQVMVPINAYRVEFIGDNGRTASDWWHEDMLVKA